MAAGFSSVCVGNIRIAYQEIFHITVGFSSVFAGPVVIQGLARKPN
jgi:hypothetical protein